MDELIFDNDLPLTGKLWHLYGRRLKIECSNVNKCNKMDFVSQVHRVAKLIFGNDLILISKLWSFYTSFQGR